MLRAVLVANMVGLNLFRLDNFQHRSLGLALVAVLTVWTGVVTWAYHAPTQRFPWLFALDLAIAVAAMAATPYLKGDGFNATVPGFWIAGALLAWAIHWWWLGGLVAATVLSLTDVAVRAEVTQTNYGHIFLLMIAGPIVGYLCGSLQRMAASRDRAEREAAASAERARLARAVHDGVLQVLSLVQRRGLELGGEGAELGRLAGEQETALRAMIRSQDTRSAPVGGLTDLAGALDALSGPHVSVVTPGTAVPVDAHVASELLAVVGACLSNVREHVGASAPAWVLLEDLGSSVVVTVRDEGPGIPSGRLSEAEADGRLGVAESIEGRMRDLGGTTSLVTGSFGTEWELTVPR